MEFNVKRVIVFISILVLLRMISSKTNEGPVFQSIKIVDAQGVQTATMIYLHWFGGQTSWWMKLISPLLPPYVKGIFPTARADIDRNLFLLPLPSWYITVIPISLHNPEDTAGIMNAVNRVHELIHNEMKAGIPSHRIMLGGISQGGALSIVAGLLFPQPLAGVVAESVYLPLSEMFSDQHFVSNLVNKNLPILQLHGIFDILVPLPIGLQSGRILSKFNANHRLQTYFAGHHPNFGALMEMKRFIEIMLPPTSTGK